LGKEFRYANSPFLSFLHGPWPRLKRHPRPLDRERALQADQFVRGRGGGLGLHAVAEEDALQVIKLVLEDAGGPPGERRRKLGPVQALGFDLDTVRTLERGGGG
jgi:hypothetical protein